MANKTDLANAGDGAEWKDVLLDLSGESLTHLHYVALSMILITLRKQNHSIWVLEWNLILEQTHIVVIALEAMLHDE